MKRKFDIAHGDLNLARFYQFQATLELAQAKRASRLMTLSVVVTGTVAVALMLMAGGWAAGLWAALFGILTAVRLRSLIVPEKYDSLNVTARKIDLEKATYEVKKVRDARREEEA